MNKHREWAYALLRITMGVNFCGHGFMRILTGVGNFSGKMTQHLVASGTPMPAGFVSGYMHFVPFFEAVVGVLLLVGLFTRTTLAISLVFIATLMAGVTSIQDWDTAGKQLVYALVLFVLLFTAEWDIFSADHWLRRRS